MKKIAMALIMSVGICAQAATTLLTETETVLPVAISTGTVKFSKADYQTHVVKILVPDLAKITIMDHRNTGEGAPCLAAYEAKTPEEVLQNRPATEDVKIKVQLSRVAEVQESTNICNVTLFEIVTADIRGFKFEHERQLYVGERHVDDCK